MLQMKEQDKTPEKKQSDVADSQAIYQRNSSE